MTARLTTSTSRQTFYLDQACSTIGRSSDSDICLQGGGISRHHAEIRFENGCWILEDQGSTFGTYVNGEKVEGVVAIKDGDAIRFAPTHHAPKGEFNFIFREAGAASSVVGRISGVVRAIVGYKKAKSAESG